MAMIPAPRPGGRLYNMQQQRSNLLGQIHAGGGLRQRPGLGEQLTRLEGNIRDTRAARIPQAQPPATTAPVPPATGGGATQGGSPGGFAPAADLAGLQAQRANTLAAIHARGGRANAPQYQQRLLNIDAQLRGLRNPTPTSPTPTDTAAPTDTTTQPPVTEPPPPPPNNSAADALFPDVNNFLPSTYEGSPLYQFQADQGQKRLERLYAARGLTGSGAEVEGNTKFLQELGGLEANRAQDLAQRSADRYYQLQQDESLRRERGGNDQFDRLYKILELQSRQNPLSSALQGTGASADILSKIAGLQGGLARDQYQRYSGGGGGARTPLPEFRPPFPGGPDYSSADLAGILAGGNAGGGYGDVLKKALAGLDIGSWF